jgi:hypothetical protein
MHEEARVVNNLKIFLASSAELLDDRREFEQLIGRKNKEWVKRGVFLELVQWEDFLDSMSQTRLQDEYNAAVRASDIFVMLFFTKVGPFTKEEFQTAFGQFKATNRPRIYTYFKDASVTLSSVDRKDLTTLWDFQEALKKLGHYRTNYKTIDELKLHFAQQLDKLVEAGFIVLDQHEAAQRAGRPEIDAGPGAVVARGDGSVVVGAGGVVVEGHNHADINTGTKIEFRRG